MAWEIVERKKVEKLMILTKTRLNSFINSANDNFYLLDKDLNFIEINNAGLNFLQRKRENVIGKNLTEIVPDINLYKKHIEALQTGKSFVTENFVPHPKFGNKHFIFKSFKVDDGVGVITIDITERKQAENQLRKLSQAMEQSPASIVITNLDGTIEYVNPKFTQVTGYTLNEAKGQNPSVLKSGEQTDEYYKILWQTISSGNEWHGEFHNKKKNGELYWESASISPIINNEGIITHYLAVKEDITEKKKAEQELIFAKEKVELRTTELNELNAQLEENITELFEEKSRALESEERYKLLVDSVMYPVLVTDYKGKILFANKQTFDFFETCEEDFYHKNISEVYDDPEKRAEYISRLQTKGYLRNMEIMVKSKNQIATVKISATVFKYHKQKAILAIFNDITKQKELEQQVLSIAIDTEEKERLNFAQELHDGLAPLLSAAKMYLQWVQITENPNEIPEYANKALALIDDSYKTAREISHMLSPHVLQKHGLLLALKNIAEKIEGAKINKIHINHLHEDVNQCFSNYTIQKQTIIYRVLLECINNTLKHANASEININFDRDAETNHLQISYADNGIGFDTEKVYTQSKGLGLLNMKNRIEWINGKMSIISEKDKGVLIKINLKP
jgi:PAS domain S-box-containing protein